MPGLVTHYIFGHSVLNNLSEQNKNKINKHHEIFNIGTQGPDMFFYYLPGLFKKSTNQLGLVMHKKNIKSFFKSVLHEMNNLKHDNEREIAFSYISGYLTHYALDYSTHKYIYYKTGFRRKGSLIKSNKFSLLHKKLETNIDIILCNVLSEEYGASRKTWEILDASEEDAIAVTKVMSKAIKTVYGRYVRDEDIKNSILYMKNVTKYMNAKEDKVRMFRKLKDDLTITEKEIDKIGQMQNEIGLDYFNLSKKVWYSPCDLFEKHNESFVDLYMMGHNACIEIINSLFDYYNYKITLEDLADIIGNYSMATGLDCDLNKPFVHFDLIEPKT